MLIDTRHAWHLLVKKHITMNRCLGADMMPAGLFTASRYSSSYNTCTATHMLTLMSLPELQACMR